MEHVKHLYIVLVSNLKGRENLAELDVYGSVILQWRLCGKWTGVAVKTIKALQGPRQSGTSNHIRVY
jgi:hypothetical protein